MTTTIDKILAKAAELEAQAASLRLAATVLNGAAHTKKRAAVGRTVASAIKVRRSQRNGSKPDVDEAPPERLTKWQKLVAYRAHKRDEVLTILKDYGKPMPIKALRAAARERGIDSLTGIVGLVRAGFLHKTGGKGKTRYSFRQMPERASQRPA